MTSLRRWLLLSSILWPVALGCGSSNGARAPADTANCTREGEPCSCAGTTEKGEFTCESGESVCACPDEAVATAPKKDAGSKRDAGGNNNNTSAKPTTTNSSADGGVDAHDAGSSGSTMAGAVPLMPFTGPLDGDPAKPMVSIPGIPCGAPNAGFGAAPPSVKITDRDVVVAYPCAHEGAAVTFFLFLHGTLQDAQKVPFTMNAFAIHKLVDSHNVIVVVPKAIGTQWGNGDNGADAPHLSDVVDWVYATFGDKFNIRSMWAQGGSWGAAYLATTFACAAKYQDKLRGIQLVVGGGCPACSNRLSCIVAQQELQLGNGMALTPAAREMAVDAAGIAPYATQHGCKPKTAPMDVGASKYWSYPDCQPGWVHSYYLGPGQHADAWDAPSVLKMTEEMKSTE